MNDTIEFQSPTTCKHPHTMCSTQHGFGQRPEDAATFFCRQCQSFVNLAEFNRRQNYAALSGDKSVDLLPR